MTSELAEPAETISRRWHLILMPLLGLVGAALLAVSIVNLTEAWGEYQATLPPEQRTSTEYEQDDGGFSIQINLP